MLNVHIRESAWNKGGFSDMNNFHKAADRHELSQIHLSAVCKHKIFEFKLVDLDLNEQLHADFQKHNETLDRNQEVLKHFINVTVFLGRQELAFRGHGEREGFSTQGDYVELVNLFSSYDSVLSCHLEIYKVFTDLSHNIQNYITESVAELIMKQQILQICHIFRLCSSVYRQIGRIIGRSCFQIRASKPVATNWCPRHMMELRLYIRSSEWATEESNGKVQQCYIHSLLHE
ncbi:hypothetical protein PR048_006919 [Dryococelus australis]|uniref:DUF4371 domain-containing protein n=1 Tax=Dryococelus australis TaxID=614101 RepID=A0ABQ9IC99_9NEOP|nr:hypothetical protein PR048_006919 [Dryococelus australis]